jgi:hypothetical protein
VRVPTIGLALTSSDSEWGRDGRSLAPDPVDPAVLVPAGDEDLAAADLKRSFVRLGLHDEDAGRPDDDVVDVGVPRAGDPAVVEDAEALSLYEEGPAVKTML